MLPTRRRLLAGSAAALVSGAGGTRAADRRGLDARAEGRGLFFGSAVNNAQLQGDASLMQRVAAECGIVVGEASFKWAALQPRRGHFTFEQAEALIRFAARRRLRVRGHTLVWHEANPAWLEAALMPATAELILTDYISKVCGHFRGRLAHWDVVNEPLHPEDGNPLGLRSTLWLKALGPRYLDIAFRAAAAADPGALRVLNEFGLDYAIDWQERRRTAMLKLLETLLGRGVPVQAVGLQAHLNAAETTLDPRVLRRFVADIAALGLKVLVTELDVRDDGLPADIPVRDAAVAKQARAFLEAVLPNPAVLGVLTWGLSDKRSWLNDKFPRKDGLPQRPLPLDANLRPTPLYFAIAAALEAAPVR